MALSKYNVISTINSYLYAINQVSIKNNENLRLIVKLIVIVPQIDFSNEQNWTNLKDLELDYLIKIGEYAGYILNKDGALIKENDEIIKQKKFIPKFSDFEKNKEKFEIEQLEIFSQDNNQGDYYIEFQEFQYIIGNYLEENEKGEKENFLYYSNIKSNLSDINWKMYNNCKKQYIHCDQNLDKLENYKNFMKENICISYK